MSGTSSTEPSLSDMVVTECREAFGTLQAISMQLPTDERPYSYNCYGMPYDTDNRRTENLIKLQEGLGDFAVALLQEGREPTEIVELQPTSAELGELSQSWLAESVRTLTVKAAYHAYRENRRAHLIKMLAGKNLNATSIHDNPYTRIRTSYRILSGHDSVSRTTEEVETFTGPLLGYAPEKAELKIGELDRHVRMQLYGSIDGEAFVSVEVAD